MDSKTGEIREFRTDEDANAAGFDIPVGCYPNPGCLKCYGRGWIGMDSIGKIPCRCVKLRKPRDDTDEQQNSPNDGGNPGE